jgi:hypothetical protein
MCASKVQIYAPVAICFPHFQNMKEPIVFSDPIERTYLEFRND